MKTTTITSRNMAFALSLSALCTLQAMAAMTKDANGNVGFDSLAECEAAIASSGVKFYQPFTSHPPLKRSGEADVKQMTLKDLTNASYARGSCDIGVGRSNERDGVSRALIGKYIPFSPNMLVNAYFDATGKLVRATMQQCDNNFSGAFPRPLGVVTAASSSECFATVQIPAKFETKTERVVKVPATKRTELIPATYKTVSEQVLVSPELKRQIPVPATYKTVSETIVVQPATEREEPIPATYKTVSETILVKAESKRLEVIPATFKAVTEQVLATPERKELKVIPAEYGEREETVEDRPATTRVETIPPTFKTLTEQVLVRPESLSYEPIALPLKTISDEVIRREASKRLEVVPATYKTETQEVLVRAASKRIETIPATFETVTEQIKISDATKEWKRGRAWIGRAIDVRPIRGFAVGADGRSLDGNRVDVAAAANASSRAPIETRIIGGDNTNLDDDVMCLVEIPAQFQTITRQVLKTPASTREVDVPAQYTTVTRQVLDRAAGTREVDIPETRQTVTRQVIDVEKLKAAGYKFDANGDITATPSGERVLRAATLRQGASSAAGAAGNVGTNANAKSAGADSGAEAYVREIKIPAQYATRTSQVIDQPASVRTIVVPGTSKVIKTRVEINPARTEEIVIPATFRTVTSQVVDKPASTREIVVPAEYRTVERRVVDKEASSRKIPVPAVTQVVTRRVVDQPASVREESTPAVYRTVSRQVVDVAASTREIDVPAQFEDIAYQVKVADARIERRSILCETNATPAKLMEIPALNLARSTVCCVLKR
jgi:hypothetical protein